jgi:Ca2+-binding RTX toxin-like protein
MLRGAANTPEHTSIETGTLLRMRCQFIILRATLLRKEQNMKRATLMAVVVGLLLALTAGVAVAREINGTSRSETLRGTSNADTISGRGGNDVIRGRAGNDELKGGDGKDRVYGMGGNDKVAGDFGDDPILRGGPGNDTVVGRAGSDRMTGDAGDDTIRAVNDTKQDFINCGEDADGQDVDTAYVNGQDVVDSQQASLITTTVGVSCEVLFVDGIRIPQVNIP